MTNPEVLGGQGGDQPGQVEGAGQVEGQLQTEEEELCPFKRMQELLTLQDLVRAESLLTSALGRSMPSRKKAEAIQEVVNSLRLVSKKESERLLLKPFTAKYLKLAPDTYCFDDELDLVSYPQYQAYEIQFEGAVLEIVGEDEDAADNRVLLKIAGAGDMFPRYIPVDAIDEIY